MFSLVNVTNCVQKAFGGFLVMNKRALGVKIREEFKKGNRGLNRTGYNKMNGGSKG